MRKYAVSAIALMILLSVVCLGACNPHHAETSPVLNGYDASLPDLSGLSVEDFVLPNVAGNRQAEDAENVAMYANAAGWYPTLIDNFGVNDAYSDTNGLNPSVWTTSPHGLRWASNHAKHPEYTNYWCDQMVSTSSEGNAVIRAEYFDKHQCDVCNAVGADQVPNKPKMDQRGRYTGGFETRRVVDELDENGNPIYNNIGRPIQKDIMLWEQAFGYYETSVRFPKKHGMWSAFWLQSTYQRKIGNEGMDGTEIDVFESAFLKDNAKQSWMGHAFLWDGYAEGARSEAKIFDLGDNDLYDGNFHKFALLWTPEYYVFFIDDQATWATDSGGVSQVREFLRFTCEIDAGDQYGPHGMNIGAFDHTGSGIFEVDYIRVYQNKSYLKSIKENDFYQGSYTTDN